MTCDKGAHQVERWTWVPSEDDVGRVPLSVEVRDAYDKVVAGGKTTVYVAAAQSGSGRSLRLLCIGGWEHP